MPLSASSSSLTIQPCTAASIPHKNPIFTRLKTPPFSLKPYLKKPLKISASSASSVTQETPIDDNEPIEKLGIVVKPMERPRLVLRFIWMEKNLGLAVDQVIPGVSGTIPLSPFFFWPRKDAWEELRLMLESKPWVSQKQMIILLNHATDIINLWQESGGELAS